jgi:hypothetical protein
MMHAVHIWRDNQGPKHAIHLARQGHIGVIELGKRIERDLEEKGRPGWKAERDDHGPFPDKGDENFRRMKPQGGHHIDVRVGMVHPVHSPENGYPVHRNMLRPHCKVEDEESQRADQPDRYVDKIEEPDASLTSEKRQSSKPHRQNESPENGAGNENCRSSRPALLP